MMDSPKLTGAHGHHVEHRMKLVMGLSDRTASCTTVSSWPGRADETRRTTRCAALSRPDGGTMLEVKISTPGTRSNGAGRVFSVGQGEAGADRPHGAGKTTNCARSWGSWRVGRGSAST